MSHSSNPAPREVARWLKLLARAPTASLLVSFGQRLRSSREFCEGFLRVLDERPPASGALRDIHGAVRAIRASLARKPNDPDPALGSRWDVTDVAIRVLTRGTGLSRFVMFGANVGRSAAQCDAFLHAYASIPNPSQDLVRVAEAVRVISAQLRSNGDSQAESCGKLNLHLRPLLLACFLVFTASAGLHRYAVEEANWETYATRVGGHRTIQLPDGSIVEMNTRSTIRYRDSRGFREVELAAGEARFKVVHDPTRAFAVFAGDTVILDVGTEFSIRAWENGKVETTVVEGVVAVYHSAPRSPLQRLMHPHVVPSGEGKQVSAGHQLTAEGGSTLLKEVSPEEIRVHEAWRNDELEIGDRTLAEMVSEINRYSERQIRIVDPKVGSTLVGGSMRLKSRDVDGALMKLRAVLPIEVSVASQGERAGVELEIYGAKAE
jgi:ferric-dicitrate binding protein FerR (iron transport regulator)